MSNLIIIEPDMQVNKQKFQVNFIQAGAGTPVILIHGLAASLYDWEEITPALTGASYATYALDLLGHGKSGKPDQIKDYTIANVFEHFSDWLDTLQLAEPPIFIGHSLGGYLALQYAQIHPQSVAALVLSDPFYTLSQLPFFLRINYRRPILNTTIIERTPEWLFRRVIDLTSLSIRNGYTLPEAVRTQTAADYKRAHPGIFNIIPSIQDFGPKLASILQPTLVLWGSRDQTLSPASFSRVLHEMPNSSGGAIAGAGHVPHQSHPAEFNKRVLKFLQSLKNR